MLKWGDCMKIVSFSELSEQDFNLKYLNSLKQFWRETRGFQCIGQPKTQDLLFYLQGCSVRYTEKNGRCTEANSGDVVYVPTGSEYSVEFFDFTSADSHTVGINFRLLDEIGKTVTLSDGVAVFRSVGEGTSQRFYQTLQGVPPVYYSNRLVLFEILGSLFLKAAPEGDPLIADGFRLLCEHPEEMISISRLAEACNISEVYFRKRFRALTGKSPAEYRNDLRMERARQYLEYGDISVQEISDTLGYSTVSHFIKRFREKYGSAPLEYRKKRRIQ